MRLPVMTSPNSIAERILVHTGSTVLIMEVSRAPMRCIATNSVTMGRSVARSAMQMRRKICLREPGTKKVPLPIEIHRYTNAAAVMITRGLPTREIDILQNASPATRIHRIGDRDHDAQHQTDKGMNLLPECEPDRREEEKRKTERGRAFGLQEKTFEKYEGRIEIQEELVIGSESSPWKRTQPRRKTMTKQKNEKTLVRAADPSSIAGGMPGAQASVS